MEAQAVKLEAAAKEEVERLAADHNEDKEAFRLKIVVLKFDLKK